MFDGGGSDTAGYYAGTLAAWSNLRVVMPQLTFPLAQAGWCVDVRVNLDSATLQSLHSVGRPLPASIPAKGLIDTGSDITVVTSSILQQLAVPVHSQRTTQGIGGVHPVRLFNVPLV